MLERVLELFHLRFGREPQTLVRAPGRVVLLGAHVDYNEGWVLPAAIDRAVYVAAAPLKGDKVTLYAREFNQQESFNLHQLSRQSRPADSWLRYPLGLAWSLRQSGHPLRGMEAVIASDVPMAAGVSSSAALEMALLMAWERLGDFHLEGLERAAVGRRAENEYLGVRSGIMDQFASVQGVRDHMILLDCRSLDYELIPVPAGTAVIVVDSGVRRQLATIDYNARPRECRQAVDILSRYLPEVHALRDVSQEAFATHAHRLPSLLRRRAKHVIEECARVLAGAEALRQADLLTFGHLICQSQVSSRDNYENSTPELDLLATTAWQVPGCYGARFAGGGFGGVMQVFCREEAVAAIQKALEDTFEGEFGRRPPMFTCKIADGAGVIDF